MGVMDICSTMTSMTTRRRTMCEGRLSSRKVQDTANSSLVTLACGLLDFRHDGFCRALRREPLA